MISSGRRLVGREREDPHEQLESQAVLEASGHVLHVAVRRDRPALGIAHDHFVVADPDDAPVSRDQAVVEIHRRRPGQAFVAVGDVAQHPLAVVRMDRVDEEVGIGNPLLLGVAHQLRDLRADVERRALGVELVDVDDERQPLDDVLEVESCHP